MSSEAAKLRVHVQPGAKHTRLLTFQDGLLRLKLAAPPIEGRANEALVALLSDVLDVAKGKIAVVRGHSSRDKLVSVEGLTDDDLQARLTAKLG